MHAFCTGSDVDRQIYCFVPWWVSVIGTTINLIAVVVSLIRYRHLPKKWWYVFLPIVTTIAMSVALVTVPIVYPELSRLNDESI